jgi:hypothetical protein
MTEGAISASREVVTLITFVSVSAILVVQSLPLHPTVEVLVAVPVISVSTREKKYLELALTR